MARNMPSRAADSADAPEQESGSPGSTTGTRPKPVHEERVGRVKALVWANPTENGVRFNVTFRRIFKRDGSPNWEQSDSFDRDALPLVMEVCHRAWAWIYAQGHQG
jgi:hypothetical protein